MSTKTNANAHAIISNMNKFKIGDGWGCIKIIFDTSRIRKGGFEFESSLLHIILL